MSVYICPEKLSDFRKSNNWSGWIYAKATKGCVFDLKTLLSNQLGIEHPFTLDRLSLLFSTKLNEESG